MFPDAQQLKMSAPGVASTVIQLAQRTKEVTRSYATLYTTPLLQKPWPLKFFLVVRYISLGSEISAFGFILRVNVSVTICGL
jgi:hypothetical protein